VISGEPEGGIEHDAAFFRPQNARRVALAQAAANPTGTKGFATSAGPSGTTRVRPDSLILLTSFARKRGEIDGTLVLSGKRGGLVKRRDVPGMEGKDGEWSWAAG